MDLNLRSESFGQDDQSWLGSSHGTDTAKPVTLDKSTFTLGTHYPNGWIMSGIGLGKITATGKYGPYDDAASDGRQTLVGFLYTGVPIRSVADNDPGGAILLHCFVVEAKLPLAASSTGTAGKLDAAGKADVAGRIIVV